jgi:hypothetical protein
VTAAETVAAWLAAVPRGRRPGSCDAAQMLTAICGPPLNAAILARGERRLNIFHQGLLQSPGTGTARERRGMLLAGAVPAAAVTEIILPGRLPGPVLDCLGITGPATTGNMPLGRALAGLAAWREPRWVRLTPGHRDPDGAEQVICCVARIWAGTPAVPVALTVERIYAGFLAAYPPLHRPVLPWPARPACPPRRAARACPPGCLAAGSKREWPQWCRATWDAG